MEKFSYTLEFYKNKLFDLKNIDLFSNKVNEANEIEQYFNKKILNLDCLRDYIIKSYFFEPNLEKNDRINYIKGLIFASDIIDYNDALQFVNDLKNNLFIAEKETLWKEKNYMIDTTNNDFLDGMYNYEKPKYVEIRHEIQEYDEEDIYESEPDYYIQCEQYDLDNKFEQISETIEPVSMLEQFYHFKKNVPNMISEIIKRKNINENDEKMVKLGMEKWLTMYLNLMECGINSKKKTLEYNNKNLSEYL